MNQNMNTRLPRHSQFTTYSQQEDNMAGCLKHIIDIKWYASWHNSKHNNVYDFINHWDLDRLIF